jgi:hypothetical protein
MADKSTTSSPLLKRAETATAAKLATTTFSRNVTSQVITVDVSDKPVIPNVVRNGVAIAAPTLNPAKVTDLIGRLGPILRPTLPRVLSQSVQSGQRITKGTSVDVVMVPVNDIKFNLLDNVHLDLHNLSVAAVHTVTLDPAIRPLLIKADTAEALTEAEQGAITGAMKKAFPGTFAIDNAVPARSFAVAFNSLKSAQAFE